MHEQEPVSAQMIIGHRVYLMMLIIKRARSRDITDVIELISMQRPFKFIRHVLVASKSVFDPYDVFIER